jgi:hypothetical protein
MKAYQRLARLLVAMLVAPAGCVHTPAGAPSAELAERILPSDSRVRIVGEAGAAPARPVGGAPARQPNAPGTGPGADPPISPDAPVLTLDEAKQLGLRLNPQVRAAHDGIAAAKGNEEVAFSGYLPTFQAATGFQAFSSHVGYLGPRGATNHAFPVLPVRGFGPGTQDFVATDLLMKWSAASAIWPCSTPR